MTNNILAAIGKSSNTQAKVSKALSDLQQLGLQGQADMCPQLMTDSIIKDEALLVMRDTLRDQETEISAYEKTLGRKLTVEEVNNFIQSHSTPALFDANDQKILARLNRNLERSRALTKK